MTTSNFQLAVSIITKSNSVNVSFNVPVTDNYSNVYEILILKSNASLIDELIKNGFSLSMNEKGLSVSHYKTDAKAYGPGLMDTEKIKQHLPTIYKKLVSSSVMYKISIDRKATYFLSSAVKDAINNDAAFRELETKVSTVVPYETDMILL
jgi:hypothetical protein